jgi:hypothetical protein
MRHLRSQAKRLGLSIRTRRASRASGAPTYSLVDLKTGEVVAEGLLDRSDLTTRLWWIARERRRAASMVSAVPRVLETPCPVCGTLRIGMFRWCTSCGFDFEPIAHPGAAPPIAMPETATTGPRPHRSFAQRARSAAIAPFAAVISGPLGWTGLLAVIASLGLLAIALSFLLARFDLPGALPCFWGGVLVISAPAALRLLGDKATRTERLAVVLVLGVALYAIKVMHSPTAFTFHDEFLHSATLESILTTGHLFGENALLPTSASFPGLEIATSALVTMTGLTPFAAAILMLGILRFLIALAVFLFMERLSRSARIAGIATFVYMANPAFVYFDAQFSYESMAVAFALVVLVAVTTRDRATPAASVAWTITALVALATATVSHHLSSYALAGLLSAWAVGIMVKEGRLTSEPGPGWLAPVAILASAAWAVYGAPKTMEYLVQPIARTISALVQIISTGGGLRVPFQSISGTVAPAWERIVGITAVVILSAAVLFTARFLWRRRVREPLIWILMLAALGYPASVALRFTSSGSEAATRLAVWLFLGVGFAAAFAGRELVRREVIPLRHALATGGLSIVVMGGIISGWPPYGRIPGPYLVGADSRSVSPEGRAAAEWALDVLGPDHRVGADRMNGLLMGSDGRQRVVGHPLDDVDLSPVFLDRSLGRFERGILQRGNVRYLVSDLRLSQALPQTGSYYDPLEGREGLALTPPTITTLEKFDRQLTVSRIYDSGNIRIYDVAALANAQ